jgi:hypothetical protein
MEDDKVAKQFTRDGQRTLSQARHLILEAERLEAWNPASARNRLNGAVQILDLHGETDKFRRSAAKPQAAERDALRAKIAEARGRLG